MDIIGEEDYMVPFFPFRIYINTVLYLDIRQFDCNVYREYQSSINNNLSKRILHRALKLEKNEIKVYVIKVL